MTTHTQAQFPIDHDATPGDVFMHYKRNITVAGYECNVQIWSGNYRPYRGVVIDSEGYHVASTGGCKGPSSALDRALQLARSLATA